MQEERATMTRKDYNALAGAIRESIAIMNAQEGDDAAAMVWAVERTAREIANVLAADNPRFDRDRFLTAAKG